MAQPSNATASSLALGHQLIDLISARDWTALPNLFTPTAQWHLIGDPAYFPAAGWQNATTVLQANVRLFSPFDTFSINLLNILAVDTQCWLEFTEFGTFNDSRPDFHNDLAIAFQTDGQKIAKVREYTDTATIQRLESVEGSSSDATTVVESASRGERQRMTP